MNSYPKFKFAIQGIISKKSDALRRSLRRHGFSHDWFSNSIADLGTKFGWNWKPDYWKDQPITQSEPLKPTFCGVLSEKVGWTSLELGTDCVVALNRQIAAEPNGVRYRGKVDGTNWRFYSRIVGKAADAGLGLTGYSALDRLWNLDSLLVEYYAKSLDIENPDEIHADGRLNLSFTVGNYADNLTMNEPRLLPHWWNPIDDWRDRSPDQLPWDYQVNGERRSICNTIFAYDLSQLSEAEREKLIYDTENRTMAASTLLRNVLTNSKITRFHLFEWTGKDAYIPAGEHNKQLKTQDISYQLGEETHWWSSSGKFVIPDDIITSVSHIFIYP